MTARQLNQLDSLRVTRAVLADKTAIDARPAFKSALAAFDALLEDIDTQKVAQIQSLPATIAARNQALAMMRDWGLIMASAAPIFAEATSNTALALKVRVKLGDFDRARLERRVTLARHIYEAIAPLKDELGDHGINPEDVETFNAAIETAEAALPAARSKVVDKRAATAHIAANIRKVQTLLQHCLDPLVHTVREQQPEFCERYRAERKIFNHPGVREPEVAAMAPTARPG